MAEEVLNDNNKRPLEDNTVNNEEESGTARTYSSIFDLQLTAFLDDDIGPMLPPPPSEEAPKKKKRSKYNYKM